MTGRCGFWPTADGPCDAPGARLYPCGDRCLAHSPAMLNGRTVPVPDPTRTLAALRAAAGHRTVTPDSAGWAAVDARAIASGKRRSTPATYRNAAATVAAQHERNRQVEQAPRERAGELDGHDGQNLLPFDDPADIDTATGEIR